MTLSMELGKNSYDIIIERGALGRVGELLKLDRRVLVVTDEGVPAKYAKAVAAACKSPVVVPLPKARTAKALPPSPTFAR